MKKKYIRGNNITEYVYMYYMETVNKRKTIISNYECSVLITNKKQNTELYWANYLLRLTLKYIYL